MSTYRMPDGTVLTNVHDMDVCAGRACVVHHPSDHALRWWPLVWHDDIGVFKRTCPHGAGHPDPDCLAYQRMVGRSALHIHTCDGCCWDRGR